MPSNKEKGILTNREGEYASGPTGRNFLLVIAVDEYLHCPKLNNCVKDARDFTELLARQYQFDPQYTFHLLNTDATRANILLKMRELKDLIQPDDNLLIYFSGHGETIDEVGYWIPFDAHPNRDDEFVSTYDLKSRLDAINSFHTFVIVDACFSGSLFLSFKNAPFTAGENRRSRWGLAASHSRERALDGSPGENSPFSARLLNKLRDNHENLSIQKLAAGLIDEVHVATQGKQTPVFKPLDVKGDDSGQFVFHVKGGNELLDWATAQKDGSLAAFQRYLTNNPEGPHAGEAQRRIAGLNAAAAWEQAQKVNTLDAYLLFIENYPQNSNKRLALEKIEKLEDHRDWQEAEDIDTISKYLWYESRHPQGEYVKEAEKRIKAIRNQEQDPEAWQRASSLNTVAGYEDYLRDFPAGEQVLEARSRIAALEREREQIDARAREEEMWSAACRKDKPGAYEAYLQEFPQGVYRSEANTRLNTLREQEQMEEERRKDQAAWEKAQQENTKGAYKQYLQSGFKLHEEEARATMAGFPSPVPAMGQWVGIIAAILFVVVMIWQPWKTETRMPEQPESQEVDFKSAVEAGSIPALHDFMQKYPDSRFSRQIEERVNQLEEKMRILLMDAEAFLNRRQVEQARGRLDEARQINPHEPRLREMYIRAEEISRELEVQ